MNDWSILFKYPHIDINKYFDQIYYINLARRIDRYNSITNQLTTNNISAIRITGIEPQTNNHRISNGQLGCLLSHLSIIKDAIIHKYARILIIEDDTIFKDNFIELFSRLIYYLPQQWQMLYLCGNHFGGKQHINPYVARSYGTLSTNAYCIDQSIMPTLYSLLTVDFHTSPIDTIYCNIHPKILAYTSTTNLCYQMASFSDIENKITDYDILK